MNTFVKRSLSGIIYVAILLGGIWYSPKGFVAVLALLQIMCLIEALTLLNLNRVLPRVLGFVLTLGLFALASRHFLDKYELPAGVTPAVLSLGAAHVGIMIFLLFMPTARVEIVPVKWAHASLYTLLPFTAPLFIFTDDQNYALYMTSIFVLIWSNDTFAYLIGRWLGKRKLAPNISPNKTIEGFLGGAGFTILIGLVFIPIFTSELSRPALLGLSIICTVGGTLGDLYESKLKRLVGVKDSGNLIPGHGGALDRLDSFLFIMPVTALFLYLLIP
jgi:phosphatidate cytidylyltransferase